MKNNGMNRIFEEYSFISFVWKIKYERMEKKNGKTILLFETLSEGNVMVLDICYLKVGCNIVELQEPVV